MKKKILVRDKEFYYTFFALMIPIALQNLIVLGAGLADNMMVGRYNEAALAGVAIVNRLQFFFQSVINGISAGVVIISSQYWGRKEVDRVKDYIGIGLRVAVVTSILMTSLSTIFARQFLGLFSSDPAVIAQGMNYLRIVAFGYLFLCPSQVMLSGLRSVETVRIGFIISAAALLVNVGINYTLIFGNFGAPEMGAKGAAIGTIASQILEFIMVWLFVFFKEQKLHYRFKELFRFKMQDAKHFFKVATPVILSNGSWGIAMAIQTFVLSRYGTITLTADSIAGNVFSFLTVFIYGAADSANVLVGKTIGENKLDKLRSYVKTLQLLFLGLGVVTGSVIFLTRDLFISIYNVSITPESLILVKQFLMVLSITSIGTAYQMSSLTGIVRGGGDTKFVFYNDMIFMWLFVLPSAALAAFVLELPPLAVYIVLKSDQILKCFVAFFKVNSFNWVRKVNEA